MCFIPVSVLIILFCLNLERLLCRMAVWFRRTWMVAARHVSLSINLVLLEMLWAVDHWGEHIVAWQWMGLLAKCVGVWPFVEGEDESFWMPVTTFPIVLGLHECVLPKICLYSPGRNIFRIKSLGHNNQRGDLWPTLHAIRNFIVFFLWFKPLDEHAVVMFCLSGNFALQPDLLACFSSVTLLFGQSWCWKVSILPMRMHVSWCWSLPAVLSFSLEHFNWLSFLAGCSKRPTSPTEEVKCAWRLH